MDKTQALRQRTKKFAKLVIRLFTRLDKSREEVRILGRQVVRSGTSVGANYREASRARSDAEFTPKLNSALKKPTKPNIDLNFFKKSAA